LIELEKVFALLEQSNAGEVSAARGEDALSVVNRVLQLAGSIDQVQERLQTRAAVIARWAAWGDFDPADISFLREQGLYVGLYESSGTDIGKLPSEAIVKVIDSSSGRIRAIVITRTPLELPGMVPDLPKERLSLLQAAQEADQRELVALQQSLSRHRSDKPVLIRAMTEWTQALRLEEAAEGMLGAGPLSVLKGFCPEEKVSQLQARAQSEGWGILSEDPAADDRIPTLLRNPEWVRVIQPLFDFMTIIPGYREADVSLCFLVFFSLFFGILIGDAGYGAIFLVGTFFLRRKAARDVDPAPFRLMYLLSACAILWGLATGTVFGSSLFSGWVKPAVPWLTETRNVQHLCFMIGVVHLTIAHVWRGIRKWPSLSVIGEAGWIALLWCAYFLSCKIILNYAVPAFMMPLLWSGVALVILFNQPDRNLLKAIGMGTGDLLLGIMGVLIDLISYIRLFAVGAAGLALAESFNAAVTSLGFGNIFVGLGTALILVLGHALNITLSMMAVLVHGLRLNILEFSVHQGIEWTGVKFDPLRKEQTINI
jgi:V/A-type H+-transporting ATPase subunit I